MSRSNPPFAESQKLLARARKVEALIAARPNLFFPHGEPMNGYPLFVKHAKGAYIWDADSNKLIDFLLGYGSVILGHADPAVIHAVCHQLETLGPNPTLLNQNHVALAEKIVAHCNVDCVTFLKTGSDATDAAVRLARAVTGKKYVLKWGLAGWHDWCASERSGVLAEVWPYTREFEFNNGHSLETLFKELRGEIACVIMMPYEWDAPEPEFIQQAKALCQSHGALFILDEVRSGFRVAIGGAQELFGISADLVAYGKALANGHAISALGGKREYMQHILKLGLTLTYYRMPDAMAAGVATIDALIERNAPHMIRERGTELQAGLKSAAGATGTSVRVGGLPWTPYLRFDFRTERDNRNAMNYFCNAMLVRGVLIPARHHWFICSSTSADDIKYVVGAAEEVFREMRGKFD